MGKGAEEEIKVNSDASLEAKSTGSSGEDSSNGSGIKSAQLFAVGQSHDKGLADVETGSEVYMSELLVSIK